METKTNVMRILDAHHIPYHEYCYVGTGAISGIEVASVLGQNPNQVFKSLVTVSKEKRHYVFLVPVAKELDLKKCAKAVSEKNIEMIPQKDLLGLTGYIHGGCSPIGLKKEFPVVIDSSAEQFETIIFSAGKIGYQVEVALKDLKQVIPYRMADIARE